MIRGEIPPSGQEYSGLTGRRDGQAAVAVEVDLLVVVQQAAVHLAQREGLGRERGRELERLRHLRPLLVRHHRFQAPQRRHLRCRALLSSPPLTERVWRASAACWTSEAMEHTSGLTQAPRSFHKT